MDEIKVKMEVRFLTIKFFFCTYFFIDNVVLNLLI